jgi:LPXTG-motif cell wall-anchored protein
MQIKQSALRIAAATTVTVFLAVGALAPSYAVDDSADDQATSSEGRTHSEEKRADRKKSDDDTATSDETTDTTETGEADHSDGTASTEGETTEPQPESTADENDGGANAGDCDDETAGSYCSTRDGSPSENGEGDGEATGKPCAGCVGKADNKNPKGQYPDGSDSNAGYECDTNKGIGQSNPAHTACTPAETEPAPVCPQGSEMNDAGECVVPAETDGTCPEGATMNDEDECTVPPLSPDQVAGVEAERDDEVLGAQANRAPVEVAPASGILPATGAGDYALVLLAGFGLLAAGGVLLARRRPLSGR